MGYKDWLLKSGLTEAQIEEKLAELDEVEVIEVDCWEELNGKVINGFRFGFIKQLILIAPIRLISGPKQTDLGSTVYVTELSISFLIPITRPFRGLSTGNFITILSKACSSIRMVYHRLDCSFRIHLQSFEPL